MATWEKIHEFDFSQQFELRNLTEFKEREAGGLSGEKDNVTENKLRQEDEKEKGKKVKTDDRRQTGRQRSGVEGKYLNPKACKRLLGSAAWQTFKTEPTD